MSSNLITTNKFKKEKLSLGKVQNKKSNKGKDYQNIPILYDEENARIRISGRFKLKELEQRTGDLSLVVQVDDDNRKLFEEFEEKLGTLINDKSLKLVKKDNVYLKIYNKPNGEMNVKFWQLFEKDGKEYRKPLHNLENLIEKNFEGEVIFKLDKIFNGKINKRKDSLKIIISVAEEVHVRGIIKEHSYFEEEYPFFEESENEDDDSRDGVDEHTPPPLERLCCCK